MPLYTERLLDSDMMTLSAGEEFKTALRLWRKSGNEEPTASLPDDDRILVHLAGKEVAARRKLSGRLHKTAMKRRRFHGPNGPKIPRAAAFVQCLFD